MSITATAIVGDIDVDIEIDLDEIVDQVRDSIDLSEIAYLVRDDMDFDGIADEVVLSYSFDRAVTEAVDSAVEDAVVSHGLTDLSDTIYALTERVATLEAALAAAAGSLNEPARRVLHGVEVPTTTTDLF
jgi:hypothetical protein